MALGPLRKDLADTYRRWVNDLEVRNGILNRRHLRARGRGGRGSTRRSPSAPGASPEQAGFTVYDRSDGVPGRHHRACMASTGATQPRDLRDRPRRGAAAAGLGTEATRLTLDWAFNILGLHNVMLTVLPSNAARHPRLREGRLQAHRRAPRRPRAARRALRRGPHGRRRRRVRQPRARRAPLSYSKRSSRSLAQRGSGALSCAWPGSSLRFAPHSGHRPGAVRAADDLVGERERVGVARPLGEVEHAALHVGAAELLAAAGLVDLARVDVDRRRGVAPGSACTARRAPRRSAAAARSRRGSCARRRA